jgi:rare lipoprotein A
MKHISLIIAVFLCMAPGLNLLAQDVIGSDPAAISDYSAYNVPVPAAPTLPVTPQNAAAAGIFRQEGIASWYGIEFAGRPTASGELFNPSDFTAAHPSLPFGTLLKVTSRHNNRQVIVRINDRGPFVSARIIDVSQAAAEVLDMIGTGTAPVIVEIVEGGVTMAPPAYQYVPAPLPSETTAPAGPPVAPGQPLPQAPIGQAAPIAPQYPSPSDPAAYQYPPVQPDAAASAAPPAIQTAPPSGIRPATIVPAMPPLGTGARYRVQVGSFKLTRNAVEAFDKLVTLGFQPNYERYEDYYRVVISGVPAEDLTMIAERLGAGGFREAIIREEH